MQKLTHTDLYSLEAYARERPAFRARVLEHKKARIVHVGDHVTLVFEDRLTVQYQIQEMLRVERIFEAAGIAEELEAYNPLIPDGANLKATMLIEYPDADLRARKLLELHDIENRVTLQVGDLAPIAAIADEDLERSTDTKTAAVHFLRFELDAAQLAAFSHAEVAIAIDHPAYRVRSALATATREALARDFA
ncbi:MAG: DUF3501 family protein [Rudaea sp.]|uniref:DUF3501 family protein n=1 Tax=unclassified Rudaea TaxID=2627037 RepID=UPI0010F91C81|nr:MULTISPECIES: DUF3501 family protein [unclassified Rudaea]MBN8886401.1 DUF3501 family protein [Rudaea sp.]MBR0346298.1 DUF3501 family protein [Rudaea sp.]